MSATTDIMEMIASLNEADVEKIYDFAAFLKYLEQNEDEEDAKAALSCADEPVYPLDDVILELEADKAGL